MTLSKRANSRQPSFGRICPSDADQREFSDAKQTGRKSSLATSLHTIANRTFQPTPRRTKAGDGRVPAPATPVWRQTPARFPLSTSPSNRPVSGPRPATSTTTRVPSRDLGIPPVPALPPRSGSRIPTLSQAPAPTALGKRPKSKVGSSAVESRPVVGSEVKRPTVCPPPQKPFVEYQDVQLLSGLSISKARRKHEDAGQEEEGDSAGSTSFRKPTMPFSRGTTASFATPKKGRMSSRSLPRSVTMATLAPSRRVTEIPPAPSLQSLHALTENRVKAAITRGVRVVTGNRNRQPPSCTPVCAASVAGTESRASTTCELNERGLPLPPIPAFPKSYSTGNLRIDSTLDKTPKAARMQRERDSTRNHPHGTPRSTVTRTQGSPMNTAPNCYVTGALSSQIQRITEPLIDLTPPRQTHPRTSESPQSVSTLVSSDGYEHLEDSIQLVSLPLKLSDLLTQ